MFRNGDVAISNWIDTLLCELLLSSLDDQTMSNNCTSSLPQCLFPSSVDEEGRRSRTRQNSDVVEIAIPALSHELGGKATKI